MNNKITVVTAYFDIESKATHAEYQDWMRNFLPRLNASLVVFTDKNNQALIQSLRVKQSHSTRIIVTSIEEFFTYQYNRLWKLHWRRDHEAERHSPDLYMIWNEKPRFLEIAIQQNPFDSEYFLWCDIGCFRNRPQDVSLTVLEDWPRIDRLHKDKVTITYLSPFSAKDFKSVDGKLMSSSDFRERVTVAGGIYGGGAAGLKDWIDVFYKTLSAFFEYGRFAGKDQNLIANMACMHPQLFDLVIPEGYRRDPWFYLQYYLSGQNTS